MAEHYDQIRASEKELLDWSRATFVAEEEAYQELMELFIEPLHSVKHQWDDLETRSAVMLLLSRLFNDIEAGHNLALAGLTEQSVHGLRDAVECMLLIRLFEAEPDLALRYMKYAKEYSAANCVALLKKSRIDAPEYELYSKLSTLAHPNIYGAIAHISEERVMEGIARTYHFGGFGDVRWIRLTLGNILGCLGLVLVGIVPRIYAPVMNDFAGWSVRVREAVEKLPSFGMPPETEPLDTWEMPADSRIALQKLEKKMAFRFRPLPKLDKTMRISPEIGLEEGVHEATERSGG